MRLLSVRSMLEDAAMHSTSTSPSPSVNHQAAPLSPRNSPVPYLFGGLAAMFGLIALALLILACSYWRLSSSGQENGRVRREGGTVDEEKESRPVEKAANGAYEEKFVVILAGENMPRFLATPALKKCTCGVHEGKMVVSDQEDNVVAVEEEKKVRGNEEKVKDTGEPTTTSL